MCVCVCGRVYIYMCVRTACDCVLASACVGSYVCDSLLLIPTGARPIAGCGGANLFWLGTGSDCSSVAPWGTQQPSASSTTCPFSFFEGTYYMLSLLSSRLSSVLCVCMVYFSLRYTQRVDESLPGTHAHAHTHTHTHSNYKQVRVDRRRLHIHQRINSSLILVK